MGLDLGLRTGVKVAVVDATGKLVAAPIPFTRTPDKPPKAAITYVLPCVKNITLNWWRSATVQLPAKLNVSISTCKAVPESDRTESDLVSEAGASVYSASELAAQEFPDLDVSLRGAVSIARRLQDPRRSW